MTELQKNIFIGTVLGGSSIIKPSSGKNCYLSMRSTNHLWLHYKMQELSDFFPSQETQKDGNTYRCSSKSSEEITEIYHLIYNNKQRNVTEELLLPLKGIALMAWFMDNGGRCGRKNKNIYLNTTKLKKKGTNIVLKYFNDMFMPCSESISTNRIRIIFTIEASRKYAQIIEPVTPLFLINRLYVLEK